MRFVHAQESDGRYAVTLAEATPPAPKPSELLVRVAASGVNRADLSQIAGRYPPPPGEPDILGLEVSGTVEATGEAVCALLAGGGHAEYVAVPKGQILPVPPGMDLVAAAGLPEAFLTAFTNLVLECGLRPRDTVLVHAGASGVGLAAIRLAKLYSARVAATTRTADKLAALEAAGADLAIDSSADDVAAAIERRFGPDAVDIVLDPVGAATLGADLRVLARGGRVVVIAHLSGGKVEVDLALLMHKRARLVGSTLRSRGRPEKAAIVARFREDVLPAFAAGKLGVTVDSVFRPEQAAEAFQRMRENRNTGKIVIDWR
ncbi:MAG: hypothetical protein AUH42_01475 [Gemmatimonadetes bacterium 13_1_40CM_70_11]|nr:MAG: hypothetical protein AUH42_01475 [Gemmatimonadetes bacterium 13_1_40CM_70_11]